MINKNLQLTEVVFVHSVATSSHDNINMFSSKKLFTFLAALVLHVSMLMLAN